MRLDDFSLRELRDLTDATVLVAASSEAGVFTALRDAPATAAEVAERLGADPRATRIVLDALVETGLLARAAEGYEPTPRCAEELCDPEGASYRGGGLSHWLSNLRALTSLAEVVGRGGPLRKRSPRRTGEQVERFVRAMAAAPSDRIERIVDLCLERRPGAASMLDVGGGVGHVTLAFVRRGVEGTLLDAPEVVEHVVDAHGLGGTPGLRVVGRDFTRDQLPEGPFDIVLMANVLHIHGAEAGAELVRRSAGVCATGGVVAAAGFFRGLSRKAAGLGVRMLLKSERGDAVSEEQVRGWMREAGLGDIRVDALDEDRHLITALRP